jgi:argininosuccinate lyase
MTLWGGRFTGTLDSKAWKLNTSLPVDQRLAVQDVRGSIAWAAALYQAGVLNDEENGFIQSGLQSILVEFEEQSFDFQQTDEDIHSAVERRLGELIGPAAGRLHTGRSRNDQVATDFRLWMLDTLPQIDSEIRNFQSALITVAEKHISTLMPGYTHLQRAQPVSLAHWLLSPFWALQRDRERFADLRDRVAVCPLGCASMAGTAVPVDRSALASALGFDFPVPNSIDGVSDRDFVSEFLFCAAQTGIHLSKLSETVIVFSTAEFGFFELSDAFSTGSSLMPQKKNPDLFELTRGKSGTLIGLLTGWLATLKGLPSTYDKDLQEDKAPVFQATDTLLLLLPVLTGALSTLTVHSGRMRAAIDPSMMATDLAEYYVSKGMPFREAHAAAGKAVRLAADRGISMDHLTQADWQTLGPADAELSQVFDPLRSMNKRNAAGGTAPQAVAKQIELAKQILSNLPGKLSEGL